MSKCFKEHSSPLDLIVERVMSTKRLATTLLTLTVSLQCNAELVIPDWAIRQYKPNWFLALPVNNRFEVYAYSGYLSLTDKSDSTLAHGSGLCSDIIGSRTDLHLHPKADVICIYSQTKHYQPSLVLFNVITGEVIKDH